MRRVLPTVLALVALSACGSRSDEQSSSGWERLSDSPLTARASVVGVWTGHEVLFVGGTTFTCHPNARCAAPGPALSDAAALDPHAGTWRRVSPAPVPVLVLDASAAVVGGDVYLLASTDYRDGRAFLRYVIGADRWEELPLPGPAAAGYRLVAAGGELVAYAGSRRDPPPSDLLYEPGAKRWRELPDSGGETVVAGAVGESGALYLGTSGLLLDSRRGQWRRMPAFLGGGRADATVVSAGRDAVVFGGVKWGRNSSRLLADVWIWHGP